MFNLERSGLVKKLFFLLLLIIISSFVFIGCSENSKTKTIIIGSKPFNEQYIVANMMAILLRKNGFNVEIKQGLGGSLINFEALKKDQIDAYLEYTGTAYNVILKLPPLKNWNPDYVYEKSKEEMLSKYSILTIAKLGFRDDYAIAIKKDFAQKHDINNLSELSNYAPSMTLGTDPEFATRQDGLPRIKEIYGYKFGNVKQMEPTLMYEAIKDNQVNAISSYTTDSRVDMFGLKVLEDNKSALPPYDAIIIVNKNFAEKYPEAIKILQKLNNVINTYEMRALNYKFDAEKESADSIAKEFLIKKGLIKD
jgi:osmoprotectant transport system substrate-binding protein